MSLTWSPTAYSFPGPEQSRYVRCQPKTTQEKEMAQEVEALKAYGVNIERTHMHGYGWEPDKFDFDRAAVVPPWRQDVLEQLGPLGPVMSSSLDTWANEEVLLEVRDGIAYCTLNRPEANNAVNDGVAAGLHDAALILRGRPDVRIVVLTGIGRMFCAGGDPKAFQQAQADAGATARGIVGERAGDDAPQADDEDGIPVPLPSEISGFMPKVLAGKGASESGSGLARTILEWAHLPQFTICCMNGSAMGGGVGLICACDMVVALRSAHITLSEVKLGIVPAAIAPVVIRTVGLPNARRLFCTSENCSVLTAMQMGIVQRTVNEVAEFPAVIKEYATKVQALAPGAVAATKRALISCVDKPISSPLMDFVSTEYAKARKGEECELGMKALASKKRPAWMEKPIAVKE